MSTATFKKLYKNLNSEQRKAVDSIEGPIMVIAGPGTGKTTILALRIANILQKTNTPPSGILAITFTDSGVKHMRLKLRETIGARADEIRLHTFHSFAASIINEYQEHFPHLSRAKQITEIESEAIIRDILREKKFSPLRPIGALEFYMEAILKTIGEAKKEALTPEMIKDFAEEEIKRIQADKSMISSRGASKGGLKSVALKRIEKCQKTAIFSEVYETYEKRKRQERKIDYDDLIFELLQAMRRDELLLRLLQENFLYILVDEHQDTNDSQNQIVKIIADFFETPNLFVVGDEKQAIFRFQGASLQNFLNFQNIWPSMKVISLRKNYRSHQGILDASFGMIEKNYDGKEYKGLRIRLESVKDKKLKPITIVEAGNNLSAESFLVKGLQNILASEKTSTVAVIVRKNREVEKVISLLEREGVPALAERGADIFLHPIGRMFFDLITFLVDPSESEALARTVAALLWDLKFVEASRLLKKIKKGEIQDAENLIPQISRLKRELSRRGPIDYLVRVAELSGLSKIALRDVLSAEVWHGIIALARNIGERGLVDDPRELMLELLDYRISAERKVIKIPSGRLGARVNVMTAHRAKGMEYDYVFLPYATEGSWMSGLRGKYFILPNQKESNDEEKDQRRLFYVALTRARKQVSIISSLEDESGRALTPLGFIAEIPEKNVSRIDLPAISGKIIGKRKSRQDKGSRDFVDYAVNVISESGLSVTALNHFVECPRKFFYKSILKVPEAPSASLEKGTAMHEALSAVWKLKSKTEKNISQTIKKSVKKYLEKSLLPNFQKEAVIDKLVSNAPTVARALKSHFSFEGRVWSERWIKTEFKTGLKDIPSIPLHGKLDTIAESGDDVFVFDYKTKKAMNEAEVRGETANSNGSYFRQLVFYKLLLQSERHFKDKNILPALVFVEPGKKGECPQLSLPIEIGDIKKVKDEIKTLIQSVSSGNFLNSKCDDPRCEHCSLWNLTGREDY